MKILQLSAHFSPNIGGVETHLDDLCKSLIKHGFQVTVLTYRPLQTKANWKIVEEKENIQIIRLPWIPNLFYRLVKSPILEFIYLAPGIFIFLPLILGLIRIDVIHAHGLIAGFVGIFWGKIFHKRVVISLHSIYHFPKRGFYRNFAYWIFNNANCNLGLSEQSVKEIKSLGVSPKKVAKFTYWIDLKKFKIRRNLGWNDRFVVLFVGRLVEEKGIKVLLESVKFWDKNIDLVIIGAGPLENEIKYVSQRLKNVKCIGPIDQNRLPLYYSGSDILIVPSTSEEGFGRVILESLACGTPVIGANRGAISETMDQSVGKLINVSPGSIKQTVEYLYENRSKLKKLASNCRKYAERRFSEENVQSIITTYKT